MDTKESKVKVYNELSWTKPEPNGGPLWMFLTSCKRWRIYCLDKRLSAFQEVLYNLTAQEMHFCYERSNEHVNVLTEVSQHTSNVAEM
jgi:hypothetical protein